MHDPDVNSTRSDCVQCDEDLRRQSKRDASIEPVALHLVGERGAGLCERPLRRRERFRSEHDARRAFVFVLAPVGDEPDELSDGRVPSDQNGIARMRQVIPDDVTHLCARPVHGKPFLLRPAERVESLEHLTGGVDGEEIWLQRCGM